MTAVEIILIIVGVIFMIGSFFITEKLSQKEIAQISELSSAEMKRILEKNMENAEHKTEELVDDVIDRSMEIAERAFERETNLKIQNISEYSETVLESIHKNHNEVMFLYSMLNDKHTELTESAGKLQKLKTELKQLEEDVAAAVAESADTVQKMAQQIAAVPLQAQVPVQELDFADGLEEIKPEDYAKEADRLLNSNQNILELYQQGKSVVEIARQLGQGVGEVKLVIDLYKGEET